MYMSKKEFITASNNKVFVAVNAEIFDGLVPRCIRVFWVFSISWLMHICIHVI